MVASFGAIIEPFIGLLNESAFQNMKIDENEVEKVVLVPLEYFKTHEPQEYNLRSEVKPYHIDEFGNKEVYLPVDELGLPEAYQKPWGHKKHKVYVYKYDGEVIWGMTAVILKDLLKRF